MTQEEKNLLLIDLCARLPYGIKGIHREQVHIITNMDCNGLYPSIQVDGYDAWFPVETFKPYLRPMSSMTDEEKEDLKKNYRFYFDDCDDGITNGIYSSHFNRTIYEMIDECDISDIIDWLLEHHFDYRWLIEKGLALEAPEDMYKIK